MSRDPQIIKDVFYRCETIEQVNLTAKTFGSVVADMKAAPATYTMAVQIENLARYMRMRIERGWGPLKPKGEQDG